MLTVIGSFFLGFFLIIILIISFWALAYSGYKPFVSAYNNTLGYGIWNAKS